METKTYELAAGLNGRISKINAYNGGIPFGRYDTFRRETLKHGDTIENVLLAEAREQAYDAKTPATADDPIGVVVATQEIASTSYGITIDPATIDWVTADDPEAQMLEDAFIETLYRGRNKSVDAAVRKVIRPDAAATGQWGALSNARFQTTIDITMSNGIPSGGVGGEDAALAMINAIKSAAAKMRAGYNVTNTASDGSGHTITTRAERVVMIMHSATRAYLDVYGYSGRPNPTAADYGVDEIIIDDDIELTNNNSTDMAYAYLVDARAIGLYLKRESVRTKEIEGCDNMQVFLHYRIQYNDASKLFAVWECNGVS